jgi:methionyl-tRNA synthetase
MERLYMDMRCARNKQLRNNPWLLLHDNMPTRCAVNVKHFLASISICVIQHPPYLPELALTISLLFLKVKLALKGEHFSDSSDIQHGVTELLKRASLQDFQHIFEGLYKGSQCCVELGVDCIESL